MLIAGTTTKTLLVIHNILKYIIPMIIHKWMIRGFIYFRKGIWSDWFMHYELSASYFNSIFNYVISVYTFLWKKDLYKREWLSDLAVWTFFFDLACNAGDGAARTCTAYDHIQLAYRKQVNKFSKYFKIFLKLNMYRTNYSYLTLLWIMMNTFIIRLNQ